MRRPLALTLLACPAAPDGLPDWESRRRLLFLARYPIL